MTSAADNAIVLEKGDTLTDQSWEVARIWITNGAASSVWINAGVVDGPKEFGFLMADTIRHGAKAYATMHGFDESETLQAIVDGVAEELREEFNKVEMIHPGKFN